MCEFSVLQCVLEALNMRLRRNPPGIPPSVIVMPAPTRAEVESVDSDSGTLTIYCGDATLTTCHTLSDSSSALCVAVRFPCNPLLPRVLSTSPHRTVLHGRRTLLVSALLHDDAQPTIAADTRLHALLHDVALLDAAQLFVWSASDGKYDTHTVSLLPFSDCTPSQTAVFEAAVQKQRAGEPVLWLSNTPAHVPWTPPTWSEEELVLETSPSSSSSPKRRADRERARRARAADSERRAARAAHHWMALHQGMAHRRTHEQMQVSLQDYVRRTAAAEETWLRVTRGLLRERARRVRATVHLALSGRRRTENVANHWMAMHQGMAHRRTHEQMQLSLQDYVRRTAAAEETWLRVSQALAKPPLPTLPTEPVARFLETRWWITTRLDHARIICA